MRAAIVAIGDELITGAVVDENSAWISDRLMEIGLATSLHLTVADEVEEIVDAFRLAGARAQRVIVTGGLGPTEDDLTRDAFCRFAGVGTIENKEALSRIEGIFKMLGREMPDNNRKQAMIPAGSDMIANPVGTAPGFSMTVSGATYYFLPGVPRECKAMMEASVLPALAAAGGTTVFRRLMFRTFGMTESQLDHDLSGLALPPGVKLGYRAVFPEIHLKLIAEAGSEDEAEQALSEAAEKVRARVGAAIYSDDGRDLARVVEDLLREKGMKLSVAESCTGGMIAMRLTEVPGSSDVFERGFVTYSNRSKIEMLGVPESVLREHGAVSSETARAMAGGALARSGADIAVAVTGIAGPTGGTADKPVGTVHIALADGDGEWEQRFMFGRWDRTMTRELTAQAALEVVRRRLLGLDPPAR